MPVSIKRVYDPTSHADGKRVLVDRLWPRGLTKSAAGVDEWLRDLAPSDDLRRWYHAQPNEWTAFRSKYLKELSQPQAQEALQRLYQLARGRARVTLLFASRDEDRNNAVVLQELLQRARKPPRGTGPAPARPCQRAAARRR